MDDCTSLTSFLSLKTILAAKLSAIGSYCCNLVCLHCLVGILFLVCVVARPHLGSPTVPCCWLGVPRLQAMTTHVSFMVLPLIIHVFIVACMVDQRRSQCLMLHNLVACNNCMDVHYKQY